MYACVCSPHTCRNPWRTDEASDFLELMLQVAVGTKSRSFANALSALNHGAMPPVPDLSFLKLLLPSNLFQQRNKQQIQRPGCQVIEMGLEVINPAWFLPGVSVSLSPKIWVISHHNLTWTPTIFPHWLYPFKSWAKINPPPWSCFLSVLGLRNEKIMTTEGVLVIWKAPNAKDGLLPPSRNSDRVNQGVVWAWRVLKTFVWF